MKRVQRHRKHLGIRSIVVRKYKYNANHDSVFDDKENIRKRDFTTTTINEKWETDITYIPIFNGG